MNISVIEVNGKKTVRLTQSKKEEQEKILLKPGERLVTFLDTSDLYKKYPKLQQVDTFLLAGFGQMMRAKEIIEELLTIAFDLGHKAGEVATSVKTETK
jgi:hypothetical protein